MPNLRSDQAQKLLDTSVSISIAITQNPEYFKSLSVNEVGDWIREKLADCGIETVPMGASHAVLVNIK